MNRPVFPEIVVNGETIPSAAIAAEAQNHDAPRGKPGIAWRKAARALAIRSLLLQEAARRGITAAPQEIAPGQVETLEEAQIRTLFDQVAPPERPTETALRAEYDRAPERFRAPPLWEVSHILLACDPRDHEVRDQLGAKAQALANELCANPARWAPLAKAESGCSSASQGGALGQLSPGDTVPEFEAALRNMSAGEITPNPILSRHGWHIIRMDAVADGEVLPFDAVRGEISAALEKSAWVSAMRGFVEGLVAGAEISGIDLSQPELQHAG